MIGDHIIQYLYKLGSAIYLRWFISIYRIIDTILTKSGHICKESVLDKTIDNHALKDNSEMKLLSHIKNTLAKYLIHSLA